MKDRQGRRGRSEIRVCVSSPLCCLNWALLPQCTARMSLSDPETEQDELEGEVSCCENGLTIPMKKSRITTDWMERLPPCIRFCQTRSAVGC